MFRLIATNLSGFRPALLRNVRSNTVKLPNPTKDFDKQFRNNSTTTVPRSDVYFSKFQQEPVLKEIVPVEQNINRFEQLLRTAKGRPGKPNSDDPKRHYETVRSLFDMFRDDALKDNLSHKNVLQYVSVLNSSVYKNRVSRLLGSRNRDSDQYQHNTLYNDVLLKTAVLDLADNVLLGQFKAIVDKNILRQIFLAMGQFKAHNEMLALWEAGVNDPAMSQLYLDQDILSVILPVAYEEKKFAYEEVISLFEANTQSRPSDEILAAVGKIAIKAGDYSRGLDSLETLLQVYETSKKPNQFAVLRALSELHLTFIGSCKDITIAKHFFDKVMERDLPYKVVLKAPHVQSLLENCVEVGESFETIVFFWKSTLEFYASSDKGNASLNSRYTILNNSFLASFFKMLPTLSEESYTKLKEVIAIYANIKPVDEFFLNTIISNYTWNDKVVFEQLVENYKVHNVVMTPVAHRVILKKIGEMEDFSNAEILVKWTESLANLDTLGYKYIPIADWAALRDATILSAFHAERTEFYLSVLDTYKNYHQDERAVLRFCKFWINRPGSGKEVARVTFQNGNFKSDVAIELPTFYNLKENVDYNAESRKIFPSSMNA